MSKLPKIVNLLTINQNFYMYLHLVGNVLHVFRIGELHDLYGCNTEKKACIDENTCIVGRNALTMILAVWSRDVGSLTPGHRHLERSGR